VSGSRFDHVAIDNVAAARLATDHLLGLGRRRLAAIGSMSTEVAQTARLRLAGFRAATDAAGLCVPDERVQEVSAFRRDEGARAMDRLLDLTDPPDAVYCFNDLLALGALHALHRRGFCVPGDVAVVGTDDIVESSYSSPTLSTVAQDTTEIAALAVEVLLERINDGSGVPPREVVAGISLKVRQSTVGGAVS
jgi:DNA-binding LacI/PurR family transcriptional regulator